MNSRDRLKTQKYSDNRESKEDNQMVQIAKSHQQSHCIRNRILATQTLAA